MAPPPVQLIEAGRDERGALAARLGKLRAAYATVTRQPQRRSIVTGAARTRRAASGVSW